MPDLSRNGIITKITLPIHPSCLRSNINEHFAACLLVLTRTKGIYIIKENKTPAISLNLFLLVHLIELKSTAACLRKWLTKSFA